MTPYRIPAVDEDAIAERAEISGLAETFRRARRRSQIRAVAIIVAAIVAGVLLLAHGSRDDKPVATAAVPVGQLPPCGTNEVLFECDGRTPPKFCTPALGIRTGTPTYYTCYPALDPR